MFTVTETFISLAVFFIIFFFLEKLFVRHKQNTFREEWFTDVLFFLGQYLVWVSLSLFVLVWVRDLCAVPFTLTIAQKIQEQPYWLQALEVIFLCDLSVYWAHRLSHRIDFFWLFHGVHHTSNKLDLIDAYR
jgi:sterol desaturase/sphingolipid hydroxylase (fatty acid hydroxylase superfamily)